MSGMQINIPVKPHLKKYLLRKLRATNDTITISSKDPICFGISILNILQKKNSYLLNFKKKQLDKFINSIDKNCFIIIDIGENYCNRSGLFIDDDKIFYINKFIEKQFRNEMFVFVNSNYIYNPKFVIEYGLEDFLSFFSITEDEYQKETLVKFYHRNKIQYSYIN
jgi:hypothetical protein